MSDTRSKQPQPTTGSSTQSHSARSQSHLEKTSDHPIVSETGSKQPQLTTGSLTQSLSAKSQSHSLWSHWTDYRDCQAVSGCPIFKGPPLPTLYTKKLHQGRAYPNQSWKKQGKVPSQLAWKQINILLSANCNLPLPWKCSHNRTLVSCHEKSALKKSKDCLTVLRCTNATGTQKLKPLMIWKFVKPCFKTVNMDALPVICKSQRNVFAS